MSTSLTYVAKILSELFSDTDIIPTLVEPHNSTLRIEGYTQQPVEYISQVLELTPHTIDIENNTVNITIFLSRNVGHIHMEDGYLIDEESNIEPIILLDDITSSMEVLL